MNNIIFNYRNSKTLQAFLGRFALLATLALAALLSTTPAYSQTAPLNTYFFPGANQQTTVILGNINPQSVSVVVAFYGTGGNIESVIQFMEPGQQIRLDPTAVSETAFAGTIAISSPLPLAASAVVTSTDGATTTGTAPFDYMPASQQATELVIPFAPADSAGVVLEIFNPGTNQALVQAVAMKTDGTEVASHSVTINPQNTASLQLGNSPGVTHVFVRASGLFGGSRPIAAAAFINGYGPGIGGGVAGAVERNDFTVVPALPFTASHTTTLPYFAEGDGYFSVIEAVNLSNVQQTFTMTAYNPDGSLVSGTNNPNIVYAPPFGATRLDFANMFITSNTQLSNGWITINSSGPVVGAAGIGNVSTPSIGVELSQNVGLTSYAYQLRLTGREIFNEMSFYNPNSTDATMTLTFLDDEADNISSLQVPLPKGQALIDTWANIFPEAQGNGYILIRSTQPIMSTEVDGRTEQTALGVLPIGTASASFTPAPQTTYLASGIVRDLNPGTVGAITGLPNVAIQLNGPVQQSTLTDVAGTYVFNNLPPGSYTVTPIPVGYTITPGVIGFTITNANSQKDNFVMGLTAPTITLITPATALVNSPSVTVAVLGSNFTQNVPATGGIALSATSGSVLAFQDSVVPTTFIDPQDLTATIPASLLSVSGNVQVFIRNVGSSGDYVQSNPFTFVVGTTGPTLTSVTGLPTPLITGAVTQPFTITVNGNGFNPASQVEFNLVGLPTTYISQYQVTAVVPASLVNTIPNTYQIVVQNPLTTASNPFQVQILYPQPTVTSISPSTITAGVALTTQPLFLTVNGTNFDVNAYNISSTATVLVNGTPVPTNYVSTTQLVAVIPPSLIANSGIDQISVTNPTPALAPSNAVPLSISNPAPVITSLATGPISFNNSVLYQTVYLPVIINGSNFSGSAIVWFNPPCDNFGYRQATSTNRISDTQVVATIPLQCSGTYQIYVNNPQPGGGNSNISPLVVPSSGASLIIEAPPGMAAPPAILTGRGLFD